MPVPSAEEIISTGLVSEDKAPDYDFYCGPKAGATLQQAYESAAGGCEDDLCSKALKVLPPPLAGWHEGVRQAYWRAFSLCLSELTWVPASVLDVGCGDATLLSWLARFNPWATLKAVEFNEPLVQLGKTYHPCRVGYQLQTPALESIEKPVDLVISNAVLNTLPAKQQAVHLDRLIGLSDAAVLVSVVHPWVLPVAKLFKGSKAWQFNERELHCEIQSEQTQAVSPKGIAAAMAEAGFKPVFTLSPLPFWMGLFSKQA